MGQSQSDKQKSCTCTSCHKNTTGHFEKTDKSSEGDCNVDSSKNTLSDISSSAGNHGPKISVSYIECDNVSMSHPNDYGIAPASSTTDNSTNPQARRDSDNKEPDNGTKQIEQNTKTGAISKSRKSLSTLTSNLRKVNSRAVSLTTKQSKKNEENNCATNSTPVKKKRPNWVMKFNCAKLKCGRNSSQNAHKQERRKTKHDNCVCTCYRKTNENCLSRNAFHPDNFNSINSMNVSVCSSVPGMLVSNKHDSGEHTIIYDGVSSQAGNFSGNGQTIATIICEKQLTPVTMESRKSLDNAQASVCARLDQSPHGTLSGGDQTPVRNSFGHATSLVRDRNPMFGYNIDSELELCRCIKNASAEIRTSNGAKQSKSGDSVNDEAAAPANRNNAVGESLYGSLASLSGAVETNNQSLNPISARHNENDPISFVCNHSQNAAQLFCHSANIEIQNQPVPRCIDWLCANNHPDNAPNSARPVLHLSPENCVRQQPAIFYQTFSPVTRNVSNVEHQQRQPTESGSRNAATENAHSGANDSAEVRESGTDNNQALTAVQFGQRRCLQLVCPTDMSVESLRALFQSHFNIDAVAKCHTQIDYVHYLVPDLLQITSCSFYWGKMDRYEAERLLDGKPEGTFLLRDSAQEEFLFSVSFRKYGRSLHARIEQWNHKFSFDSHDPGVYSSDTVCGLIEHYKDPTCCMFFEPILTLPLHRNFTFTLQHLSRATIANKLKYDTIDVLQLPTCLKAYLKEYHYRQRVRIKRFDGELQYVDFNPT